MAELRRVGGEMVPSRGPGGRRVLLPVEAELCNAIGISEDEYWHFLALTEAYNGERAKEYELIPDVRNDPISIIVSLVIGIALSAIGALLAPKPAAPEQQKTPPSLKTADQAGTTRFAPQTSFDSVQELASLGATIPLVFTRKGVRVTSQLLWSQMLSLGTGQQLRAIMLLGSYIEAAPDFAGFAIGDTLLENYTKAKLALYFKTDGGRILEWQNRYPEGTAADVSHADAFSIFWDRDGLYQPYFSGVRTPSTQTQFGAYDPMPNGNAFKVNYELVLKAKDADGQLKADVNTKRAKINRSFPCRAAVVVANSTGVIYRIEGGKEDPNAYNPWGLEDVNSSVESIRVNADNACAIGDLYLVGERFAVGHYLSSDIPWNDAFTKDFHIHWSDETPYVSAFETSGTLHSAPPYGTLIVQRAAIAVVSNNRSCDATEIGLKSTVWKQISGFSNVNSQPNSGTIAYYEDKNGNIGLGSISKYIKRLSFFRVFARPLGSNAAWVDLSGGTLFCVQGQTPQPQYNYFRFVHGRGQYEFKFAPVPGNLAHRAYTNGDVWLLRSNARTSFVANGFTVVFGGIRFRLTANAQSNTEWIVGPPPPDPEGKVINVSRSQNGTLPTSLTWQFVETRYDGQFEELGPNQAARTVSGTYQTFRYKWDGNLVGAYGRRTWDSTQFDPITVGNVQYRVGDFVVKDRDVYYYGSNGSSRVEDHYRHQIQRWELRPVVDPPVSDQVVNASGGSGSGLQFRVLIYSNGSSSWTIYSGGAGYGTGDQVLIPVANQTVAVQTNDNNYLSNNLNPYDAVADFTLYDAERTSHMDGPEHEVVYVSEQLEQVPPAYDRLAIAGLRINSTKEWASFNSLSAFIKRGTPVERLTTSGVSATNLLPEITYALLTDGTLGAGASIGAEQVDRERMALAALFCEANGFTWDGVIAERINLRGWIYEQAGYCLLDFTILGGRFSLVPSVPFTTDYKINFNGKPDIKALFTDGNIRDLKVTWLSPEERRLFKATCLWRKDKDNGFPETKVLSVRLSGAEGGADGDPEETFDMSGWCTTSEHPYLFARYALKLRQLVDHAVTFQTYPQAAMNLAPGEYFRLVSEATHTSRFNNGSIGPDGSIQSVDVLDGTYQILYWEPGTVGVKEAELIASQGRTEQQVLWGSVFAIQTTTTTSRVYKVETLNYGEDGLIEVAASHVPLTDDGRLAVLDWRDDMFVVEAS